MDQAETIALDDVITIMEGIGLISWGADALRYLKEYQKLKKQETENEPLTWDEILEMNGKPVWVEILDTFEYIEKGTKFWTVIKSSGIMKDGEKMFVDTQYLYFEKDKGKKWEIYRREHDENIG